MVKNQYEKVAKKQSEKKRLLFHTSGAEKCHEEQERTSMGGVLGSEGRGKGRGEPLP